jgi:hypothetical protein
VFDEEVAEADVLRFAIDGKLRLSVDFVNPIYGRRARLVPISEAEYEEVPALGGGTIRVYKGIPLFSNGQKSHIAELEERVVALSGVFDLAMIGSEQLDVKHYLQRVQGGPAVTAAAEGLSGPFVEGRNGQVYQLQMDLDDKKYRARSSVQLEKLKQRIVDENIGMEQAAALLDRHKEDHNNFLIARASLPERRNFHQAVGLPLDDCIFVVRTDALREFEARFNEPGQNQKPESTRKTDNLLLALVCVAIDAYGYNPALGKNTAPKDIASALGLQGVGKDEKTIREWLKEGSELLPPKP